MLLIDCRLTAETQKLTRPMAIYLIVYEFEVCMLIVDSIIHQDSGKNCNKELPV